MTEVRRKAPRREDRPFHMVKPEYAENSLSRALSEGRITPDDAQLIRSYVREQKATEGICVSRANKHVYTLIRWRSFIGPFRDNKIFELYEGIEGLKTGKRDNGKPFTKNSIHDFVGTLRRFYLWLIENSCSSVPEDKVRKIRLPKADTMTVTAQDILTREEVKAMLGACRTSRDRAMIALLYEGAFRIEEAATLVWGQVKFDEYGVAINVNVKVPENPRYVRLVSSVPYLAQYKVDYPFDIEPQGLIFMSNRYKPMIHEAVSIQLKKIARRAGITKRVHPHLFRHSRITHMREEGYNDSTIKQIGWGNQGTKMLSTYLHITNTSIDDEVLEKNGIQRTRQNDTRVMKARECSDCHTVNGPTHAFCCTCGRPLTDDAITDLSTAVTAIETHPLYKAVMEKIKSEIPATARTSTS